MTNGDNNLDELPATFWKSFADEIRGDDPADEFEDDLMEGWLRDLSVDYPRLSDVFARKDHNPPKWAQIKSELRSRWQGVVKGAADGRRQH